MISILSLEIAESIEPVNNQKIDSGRCRTIPYKKQNQGNNINS